MATSKRQGESTGEEGGFSYTVALYAARMQAATERRGRAARLVMGAFAYLRDGSGLERAPEFELLGQIRPAERAATPQEWARAGEALRARVAAGPAGVERDMLKRLEAIGDAIGLGEADRRILGLAVAYRLSPVIETFFDRLRAACPRLVVFQRSSQFCLEPLLLPALLDLPGSVVREAIAPEGKLLGAGLLQVDRDGECHVLGRVLRLVRQAGEPADMRAALLRAAEDAPLPWEAFGHVGEAAERAAALLRAAFAAAEPGINILLHGPPGTGKTSFASSLAAAAGLPLYAVGLADGEGDEPDRSERLGDLRLAQRLLQPGRGALLFDEAEDLLGASEDRYGKPRGSRAYLHRLIERTPVPILWTANDTGALGERIVRRMTFCIEMRRPPRRVLAGMWQRIAGAQGLSIGDAEAERLARLVPAAPALVEAGARMARLTGDGAPAALAAVESIARAIHGAPPAPGQSVCDAFDPALINAGEDLEALIARLAAPDAPRRISLLLEGPPGAGKSEFVRHLAQRMGLELVQKRASDLLDPFVGGTEARIARAFAEAREDRAFLVFDEADSLLADRARAQRNWEVSQVNEMLTWMESHPYPFACTTNLGESLDRASLRRFLIKLRFDFMTEAQCRAAFLRFFGMGAPPGIAAAGPLVPADFALVQRRFALTGEVLSAEAIMAALAAEARGRPGAARPMGFARCA